MPYADKDKHLAYMREYHKGAGKQAKDNANRAWRERNRTKQRAHSAVARAVRKGTLVKPLECEGCGPHYEGKLEAHHDDYTKPLDVKWLCDPCHKQRHIELRLEARPFQEQRWGIHEQLGIDVPYADAEDEVPF